jgi:hypothetical protein
MAEFIAMLSGLGQTSADGSSTDDKKFPWGWVLGGAAVAGILLYMRRSKRPSEEGITVEDLMVRDSQYVAPENPYEGPLMLPPPQSDRLMGIRRRKSRKSSRRRHSRRRR